MPIKLIQVQRKLNVGINTVVEFLRKKGFEVEDNNPNTRIGDEQYALLVKEFGKDLPNGGRERERVVPERSHREASSVKEEKSSEIKTVIPEEFRPKIVTKGRIDLDRPHKKVQWLLWRRLLLLPKGMLRTNCANGLIKAFSLWLLLR